MSELVKIDNNKPAVEIIKRAAKSVKEGGLVIFPTDTVYGLGANANLPGAVEKIYTIKKRPFSKPMVFLIASQEHINNLVKDVSPQAMRLMEYFWPGPMTIIFKASSLGTMMNRGIQTIGLRIPDNKVALRLIEASACPIAATSVNVSGEGSAVSCSQIPVSLLEEVDIILDSGSAILGRESSVVDVSTSLVHILREGVVSKEKIKEVLGNYA